MKLVLDETDVDDKFVDGKRCWMTACLDETDLAGTVHPICMNLHLTRTSARAFGTP